MKKYSPEKIDEIIQSCENELFSKPKITFSLGTEWSSHFPNEAGIYAIFENGVFVYVGETANLKERMKDVRRTANHSFRRKLGKKLDAKAEILKHKFHDSIESIVNDYCVNHISFTFIEINFGRLEIESHIMQRHKGLLNSLGKRDKIK